MSLTTDRNDPALHETRSDGQNRKYLVLSSEEIAKGYVKPYRDTYIHDGPPPPKTQLRDLTQEEHKDYDQYGYVKFEAYLGDSPVTGKFWTQLELDRLKKGCGVLTTMGYELSATYARDPKFYGATYCCGCGTHYPLYEFRWDKDGEPMDPYLQDAWAVEQQKKRDAQRASDAEWDADRLTHKEEARVKAALSLGDGAIIDSKGNVTSEISIADLLLRIQRLESIVEQQQEKFNGN